MGLLDDLMSGAGGARQQQYGDFINRYSQGAPHEGITDEETGQRYSEVAGELDPQTYHASARDALANMTPDDRADYANQLHAHAQHEGVQTDWDQQSTDPDTLAAMTGQVHSQAPNLLGSLLGGGAGGGGLGGLLGGGGGGGNPVMKAALGGIAAMAAKRMMGGGGASFGL